MRLHKAVVRFWLPASLSRVWQNVAAQPGWTTSHSTSCGNGDYASNMAYFTHSQPAITISKGLTWEQAVTSLAVGRMGRNTLIDTHYWPPFSLNFSDTISMLLVLQMHTSLERWMWRSRIRLVLRTWMYTKSKVIIVTMVSSWVCWSTSCSQFFTRPSFGSVMADYPWTSTSDMEW